MEIRVLASSSAGNCYVVSDGETTLLLECGISMREISEGVGFRLAKITAVLLTHEHGDHSRAVRDVARAGLDVYASAGTLKALQVAGHRFHAVTAKEPVHVGTWIVLPFDVPHDAAEPLGFMLESAASGERLLYLTDAAYCRYRFRDLTHVMVGANYSAEILRQRVEDGDVEPAHRRRVLKNHMSLERVVEMLRANDLSRVEEIWLLHLSDDNSDEGPFVDQVARLTGKPVFVAPKRAA